MATGETGFDDVTFDLISLQYHSLKAGHDYGQYIAPRSPDFRGRAIAAIGLTGGALGKTRCPFEGRLAARAPGTSTPQARVAA